MRLESEQVKLQSSEAAVVRLAKLYRQDQRERILTAMSLNRFTIRCAWLLYLCFVVLFAVAAVVHLLPDRLRVQVAAQ